MNFQHNHTKMKKDFLYIYISYIRVFIYIIGVGSTSNDIFILYLKVTICAWTRIAMGC